MCKVGVEEATGRGTAHAPTQTDTVRLRNHQTTIIPPHLSRSTLPHRTLQEERAVLLRGGPAAHPAAVFDETAVEFFGLEVGRVPHV